MNLILFYKFLKIADRNNKLPDNQVLSDSKSTDEFFFEYKSQKQTPAFHKTGRKSRCLRTDHSLLHHKPSADRNNTGFKITRVLSEPAASGFSDQ